MSDTIETADDLLQTVEAEIDFKEDIAEPTDEDLQREEDATEPEPAIEIGRYAVPAPEGRAWDEDAVKVVVKV